MHWVALFNFQEFTVRQQAETSLELTAQPDDDETDAPAASYHQGNQQQQQQDTGRKPKAQTKQRLEPSLKWKALGLEEENMQYDKKKPCYIFFPFHIFIFLPL